MQHFHKTVYQLEPETKKYNRCKDFIQNQSRKDNKYVKGAQIRKNVD